MSTRFRGVHNPMKYVVYDIIESQAGAGALFIGAAVDVNECSSCLRHFRRRRCCCRRWYGRFGLR